MKIVEDDQGKWWGQNVELHIDPSWWEKADGEAAFACGGPGWTPILQVIKLAHAIQSNVTFSYKTGEDWRRKSGYC